MPDERCELGKFFSPARIARRASFSRAGIILGAGRQLVSSALNVASTRTERSGGKFVEMQTVRERP